MNNSKEVMISLIEKIEDFAVFLEAISLAFKKSLKAVRTFYSEMEKLEPAKVQKRIIKRRIKEKSHG